MRTHALGHIISLRCDTSDMLADMLTKALNADTFRFLRKAALGFAEQPIRSRSSSPARALVVFRPAFSIEGGCWIYDLPA